MTQLEREFRRLAAFHGEMMSDGRWLSIDLTRRPWLGSYKADWAAYIILLVNLLRLAAMGRAGMALEYNRFLKLRIRGGD